MPTYPPTHIPAHTPPSTLPQAWLTALVKAELPVEAAEALKGFLGMQGGEVVKGDRPESPAGEGKLGGSEQSEADRRSSLAQ